MFDWCLKLFAIIWSSNKFLSLQDIKSYCKDIPGAFPYPIIADHDRKLAVKLDMIDERDKDDSETALTVRALYIISPDHRLRLSMHYPQSTGRNVEWVDFEASNVVSLLFLSS